MKIVFQCDFCKGLYDRKEDCLECEKLHIKTLDLDEAINYLARIKGYCECCENSYLVYGCELDCKFKKGPLPKCSSRNGLAKFIIKPELKDKWIKEYNLNE